MDKRARERDKDKGLPSSKRKAKGGLVEGQITTDQIQGPWPSPATAYPDRINPYLQNAYTENWTGQVPRLFRPALSSHRVTVRAGTTVPRTAS